MFEEYKFQWEFLKQITKNEKIPRVLIFSGRDLKQIEKIAKNFIKILNCKEVDKNNNPCQKCYFCKEIENEQFPDLIIISPEDKNEISIEQTRDLKEKLSFKPFISKFKIVLIKSAQFLNDFSQNSILKILEEGSGNQVIFILLVDNFRKLKETIISRGVVIKFPLLINDNISDENLLFFGKIFGNSDLVEKFLFLNTFLQKINEENDKKRLMLIGLLDEMIIFLRLVLLRKIGIKENFNTLFMDKCEIDKKYTVLELKQLIEFVVDLKNNIFTKNINERLAMENLILNLK